MATIAILKTNLMQAWRERWSEARWSIGIQHYLINENDQEILTKLLLEQAVIGSSLNTRILLYLKYSLQSSTISYAVALKCLSNTKLPTRRASAIVLLDYLDTLLRGAGRAGCTEDSLQLSEALLSTLQWLINLTIKNLHDLQHSTANRKGSALLESLCSSQMSMMTDETISALIYIANKQSEGVDLESLEAAYLKMPSKHSDLRSRVNKLLSKLRKLGHLKSNNEKAILSKHPLLIHLISSVDCLYLNTDISSTVSNYKLIQRLQSLETMELYIELIWCAVTGMLNSANTEHEIKWICFLYVKLPNTMQKIQSSHHKENIVEQALLRVVSHNRLFDLLDLKYQCNCLEYLLNELKSRSIISDFTKILSKRDSKIHKPIMNGHKHQTKPDLILKSNEAIHSLIKSIESDIADNLSHSITALTNFLTGYEYNLVTMAANGLINKICDHLIRVNEYCKDPSKRGESNQKKVAQIFDVTFMLLCDITQRFKYKSLNSNKDCFFTEWSRNFISCTMNTHRIGRDSDNVNNVLTQCLDPSCKSLRLNKTSLPKLYLAVVNCMKHTLEAYIAKSIQESTFKSVFQTIQASQHSLCLYASYWLIQYSGPLSKVDQDIVKSALLILSSPSDVYESPLLNKLKLTVYYKHLSMQNKIHTNLTSSIYINEKFMLLLKKGSLDYPTLDFFSNLINIYGTNSIALTMCQELIKLNSLEDLNKGLSIVAAIFHLNINAFTLSLLKYVLPKLIMLMDSSNLVNPKGTTLCSLVMFCVSIYFNNRKGRRSSKKRSFSEVDHEHEDDSKTKHSTKTRRKYEDDICDSFSMLFKLFQEILQENQMLTIIGFIKAFFVSLISTPSDISSAILKLVPIDLMLLLQKYLPDINLHYVLSCDLHSGRANRRKITSFICRYSLHAASSKKTAAATTTAPPKPFITT